MKIDEFTRAYIDCALWSTSDQSDDQGGDPLDKNYDVSDLAPECLAQMMADCQSFQNQNNELLEDWEDGQAGHDFWLTRNRHGAGFWDRTIGNEVTRRALTDASHAFGEVDLYIGDDGMIYQM